MRLRYSVILNYNSFTSLGLYLVVKIYTGNSILIVGWQYLFELDTSFDACHSVGFFIQYQIVIILFFYVLSLFL